uniref:translation initiation factor IF-2-like n=1 Tax=Nyctereutes procyonoides TaxID=34880 RepID=UPI002444BB89|nr:translation initiation factor IF-2-like [Nyctereutes procyonoides]
MRGGVGRVTPREEQAIPPSGSRARAGGTPVRITATPAPTPAPTPDALPSHPGRIPEVKLLGVTAQRRRCAPPRPSGHRSPPGSPSARAPGPEEAGGGEGEGEVPREAACRARPSRLGCPPVAASANLGRRRPCRRSRGGACTPRHGRWVSVPPRGWEARAPSGGGGAGLGEQERPARRAREVPPPRRGPRRRGPAELGPALGPRCPPGAGGPRAAHRLERRPRAPSPRPEAKRAPWRGGPTLSRADTPTARRPAAPQPRSPAAPQPRARPRDPRPDCCLPRGRGPPSLPPHPQRLPDVCGTRWLGLEEGNQEVGLWESFGKSRCWR